MFTLLEMLELSDGVLLKECHEKLIMDYNKLHDAYEDASKKNSALIKVNCEFFNKIVDLQNENRKLKKENDEAKEEFNRQLIRADYFMSKNGCLEKKYDILERKYWDAQRTIDQYAQENENLKKERTICSTRIRTYKLKDDISKSEQHIDERTAKFWQNRYEEANKERINLRNKLANVEKYLVGYQKLYSEECEINRELRKQIGKTPELDALNAMETLVGILNRGKDDAADDKS